MFKLKIQIEAELRASNHTDLMHVTLAVLNLQNFYFFVRSPFSEWKWQVWSKSDNSQLKYGDKAIFKMAAVRHLDFAKIAVLVSDLYRNS